ncbi:DnaB-like helicase C-terminal domain-containing protein [Brevibacillus dissolubilis]|uniref:DnaB-like helicase C-terminal domain-containing protein n=1 Tax=Brevibacillus dissolubilis TaxID=1844116 RepID=UPI00159BC752|nr:DnaB-like helicase C-terminal domain-containing protein [Brevibacillus dissolubilis]
MAEITKRFSWEDLDQLVEQYSKQMILEAYAYLNARGIKKQTAEDFRLGYEKAKIGFHANGKGTLGGYFSNRIIFPIIDADGKTVDLVGRAIDNREPKYRSLLGRNDTFFNHPIIASTEDVILVRNVFDVMSLAQERLPAISLPDTSPFRDTHAQQLTGKRVFICYPNDEPGHRESLRIAQMLEGVASDVFIVQLPEGVRDVNDMFVRGKDPHDLMTDLLNEAVSENLKMPVLSDARSLSVFTEEYMKRQKGLFGGIATGFPELDAKLTGGLHPGLYLLMGNISTGKSMLLRQMADQIAGKGVPVVYVSWEMTAYELWCRSMARLLHVEPSDMLSGKVEMEKITQATQAYGEVAKHMMTIEGTLGVTLQDIEETIQRIIQANGKAPVIIIDDLFRINQRDNQGNIVHNNQAMNVYQLHQWSKQFSTPIVISASIKDLNQSEIHPLVEVAVDTIIHFEAKQKDDTNKSQVDEISLNLVKNRNGTNNSVKLQFDKQKAEFFASQE